MRIVMTLSALALLAPQMAHAGADGLRGFSSGGFYARADGGYAMESDQDADYVYSFDYVDASQTDDLEIGQLRGEIPDGVGFSVGLGWSARHSGLRLEALLTHDRRDESVAGLPGVDAELRTTGLYGIAYYDFYPYNHAQPFLGLGAGFNSVEIDADYLDEDVDARLSFLATAGMGFVISDRLVGDIAYRYQFTPDLEHDWVYTDADPSLGYTERLALESDLNQHTVTFGLRYMLRPPQ